MNLLLAEIGSSWTVMIIQLGNVDIRDVTLYLVGNVSGISWLHSNGTATLMHSEFRRSVVKLLLAEEHGRRFLLKGRWSGGIINEWIINVTKVDEFV